MNIKKTFAMTLITFALSAAAFGQIDSPRNQSQFSLYGMHFINGGQTARISVQNPRFSDPEIIPCIRVTIFFDVYEAAGDGSVRLRFSRRVSREILLDGGEAATFDFPAGRSGDWISPIVFAEMDPTNARPLRLLSTLTVRQFGTTILNLPIVEKGFDPQPDPPSTRP